jgi:hypothetical protein
MARLSCRVATNHAPQLPISFDSVSQHTCGIHSFGKAAIDVAKTINGSSNNYKSRSHRRPFVCAADGLGRIATALRSNERRSRAGIALATRPKKFAHLQPRTVTRDCSRTCTRRRSANRRKSAGQLVSRGKVFSDACQIAHKQRGDWQRAAGKVVACRPRHTLGRDPRSSRVAPLQYLKYRLNFRLGQH